MEPINETIARQLLDRYFEGETTRSEEHQLATFFIKAPIPEDLMPYSPLFRFFMAEAAVMPPRQTTRLRPYLIRILAPLTAAAAGVILFFALYHPATHDFVYIKDGQQIKNRNEAIQVAQQQWEQMTLHIQKANDMVDKLEQMTTYTETIHKYISK